MHGKQWVERRSVGSNSTLSWDIARHYFTRQQFPAVVVADNPEVLYSVVRKQWQKVIRQVQRERSSTLDVPRIYELSTQIARMQSLHMGVKSAAESPRVPLDLRFADVNSLLASPPTCRTLYITVRLHADIVEKITSQMPAGGLIVMY